MDVRSSVIIVSAAPHPEHSEGSTQTSEESLKRLSDRLTPQWRHRLFTLYLVVMMLVFLAPTPDTGFIESRFIDKVVHFVLFFGFAVLFYVDRAATAGRTFLISAAFAACIELVQWVLPFRSHEFADFVAGSAGAGLAAVLMLMQRKQASGVASGRG
jgi:VanZ family protein